MTYNMAFDSPLYTLSIGINYNFEASQTDFYVSSENETPTGRIFYIKVGVKQIYVSLRVAYLYCIYIILKLSILSIIV